MSAINRRRMLGWCALAPVLPQLLAREAFARTLAPGSFDGRVVVVIRMLGGNDGLNAVVPIRDDRYYRLRPTIGIAPHETIRMNAGEQGLNPALADFHNLMEEGNAGIVQSVGYPRPSRSHIRATQILETGSLADRVPATGWLGGYLDAGCACGDAAVAGLQFGDDMGRTLGSQSGRTRLVGNPTALLELPRPLAAPAGEVDNEHVARVLRVENALRDAARELAQASHASGRRFAYPDTDFGQSLRWTGDLIESRTATRIYCLTLGSFATPSSASFDTHIDQKPKHEILYRELGRGLKALTRQLRRSGDLQRVVLLTYSDFGRQIAENKTRGTDHGDAGLLFYAGGAVRAGLRGERADLGKVTDGGLDYRVDFRSVYADVLQNWLRIPAEPILGAALAPFPIVRG